MSLDFKQRSLLKLNFMMFLNHHFIREGAYINIGSGQQFYDGSNMSLLLPDADVHNYYTNLSIGQVFQSPFRNWVYESGVPLDGTNIPEAPKMYSGVYIEGTLRTPNDATFGHTVDFLNGRIIFDSPQSLDLLVQADFCAKEVRIAFEHAFNQQFNLGFLESKYTTNPETSFQLIYPSGFAQPFPAIFIEAAERDFDGGYEIGNRSMQIIDTLKFHIWSLNDLQRDNIVDILTAQVRKALPIINFNLAPLPLSGIFNTLSPEYISYPNLLRNNTIVTSIGSGIPILYMGYIDEAFADNREGYEEFERATVTYRIRTILNAPTTPLGHIFGPITTLPTIEDIGF